MAGSSGMAEREGFEPPCRLPGKTLSRRPRYDHFGTSPFITTLRAPPAPFAARSRSPSATSLRRSLAEAALQPLAPSSAYRFGRQAVARLQASSLPVEVLNQRAALGFEHPAARLQPMVQRRMLMRAHCRFYRAGPRFGRRIDDPRHA